MEKYHIYEMINILNASAEKCLVFENFNSDYPGLDFQNPYGMSQAFYRKILNVIC